MSTEFTQQNTLLKKFNWQQWTRLRSVHLHRRELYSALSFLPILLLSLLATNRSLLNGRFSPIFFLFTSVMRHLISFVLMTSSHVFCLSFYVLTTPCIVGKRRWRRKKSKTPMHRFEYRLVSAARHEVYGWILKSSNKFDERGTLILNTLHGIPHPSPKLSLFLLVHRILLHNESVFTVGLADVCKVHHKKA